MRMGWSFAGVMVLAATSASATDLPKSGTYAAAVYVNDAGAGCADSPYATYDGFLNYGGIGYAHAGLRVPIGPQGYISVQALTATAGLGTLTPSGTFTWKISDGQGGGQTFSGTWSATLAVVDTVSFVAHITEKYNNICTEHLTVALTRVGAHQN